MTDRTTVFATGKIYWAKIFGTPRPNYDGDAREWTLEFEPDDVSFLKEHKLLDRLKDKHEDRPPYLVLRKSELNKDGDKNEPIRVYNEDNEAWDDNKMLGNGTVADVKLVIADYGKGKKKGIYVNAIRVTDYVPYISNEFAGMDTKGAKSAAGSTGAAKKPSTKAKAADLEDLDDDMPF